MNRLKNRWALVTGSSRGIGQQIALGLAGEGCNLIVHARRLENTKNTIGLLSSMPIKTLAVSGELGNIEEEKLFVKRVIEEVGHIDILYNNAAVMSTWNNSIFEIPIKEWTRIFEVNLFSMVRICNMLIPAMLERDWGRVINLSSGIKGIPQLAPYGVSKAAVDKYTMDLASEAKGKNVLVNALDPGWLKTELGGENAEFDVETVLPGAVVPAILEDFGPSGQLFCAQDYKTV